MEEKGVSKETRSCERDKAVTQRNLEVSYTAKFLPPNLLNVVLNARCLRIQQRYQSFVLDPNDG